MFYWSVIFRNTFLSFDGFSISMTSKIDPPASEAVDIGERSVVLEMEHQEAIEYVREVCLKHGFGIAVEFSVSEILNEKIGANRTPYYILGACNPKVADRALDISHKIGGLFPCNMVVCELEPGVQQVYHVSIMKIARSLGMAPDNEDWQEIVDETGVMVSAVFRELEE